MPFQGSEAPKPEARGSAEETQMTPLESTQNRPKISPESTQNQTRIKPESPQNLWGTLWESPSGDPPPCIFPRDPLATPRGTPNRNRHEPIIAKKVRKKY